MNDLGRALLALVLATAFAGCSSPKGSCIDQDQGYCFHNLDEDTCEGFGYTDFQEGEDSEERCRSEGYVHSVGMDTLSRR